MYLSQVEMFTDEVKYESCVHVMTSHIHRLPSSRSDSLGSQSDR